jgi:hypothetical protein
MPTHRASAAFLAETVAAAGFVVTSAALAPVPAAVTPPVAASLGAALAASVWAARAASGGHVSPANTLALLACGAFAPAAAGWWLGGLATAILPGARLFHADGAPGCVASLPSTAAARGAIFVWEALGTTAVATALLTTARGAAAATAPVAVGVTFAVWTAAAASAGVAVLLSPLRAVVPPLLYGCGAGAAPLYLAAQVAGALVAAAVAPALAPATGEPAVEAVGEARRAAGEGAAADPLLGTPAPVTPAPGYGV